MWAGFGKMVVQTSTFAQFPLRRVGGKWSWICFSLLGPRRDIANLKKKLTYHERPPYCACPLPFMPSDN